LKIATYSLILEKILINKLGFGMTESIERYFLTDEKDP
jgi:hypothetical protein